ncbi:hypothetical protein VTI74DRAFT_2165 [Chaetomium olivicolor]
MASSKRETDGQTEQTSQRRPRDFFPVFQNPSQAGAVPRIWSRSCHFSHPGPKLTRDVNTQSVRNPAGSSNQSKASPRNLDRISALTVRPIPPHPVSACWEPRRTGVTGRKKSGV